MNLERIFSSRSYNMFRAMYISKSDIMSKVICNGYLNNGNFSTSSTHTEKFAHNAKPDWSRAVSEAEKVVGYPTSFLSLRWLLSDEIANVALHLRKLVGSNHPLLKTAKNLLYNGKNNMQAWGLIVLLISKAAGHTPNVPDMEQDKSAGVLHSQRALAEVTEMIRTSHLVHQGLVNLQPNSAEKIPQQEDMTFGNKIALLSGDYLLGNSCVELANLRNQEIVELMSSALRDLSESEFIGLRDSQNIPLPSPPIGKSEHSKAMTSKICSDEIDNLESITLEGAMGNPSAEWELRHILSAGSLLGKSCQGTLKLAGHPDAMQKQGYLFGKHLALAWQACIDLEPFQSSSLPLGAKFSLVSAPVLFHIEHDPNLYKEIEKGRESVENIDYDQIHMAIMEGPGLARTKELQRKHATAASEVLTLLPPSDARTALNNIIVAMQDL